MQAATWEHISDKELLDRYRSDQNTQWLGILLQRYTLLLLGVCMKYLRQEEAAKDAVQQIFLKAITEMGKYEIAYPKSWLYMVARNHCLMQLRDRHRMVPMESETGFTAPEPALPELRERETSLNLLERAMDLLGEAQKTCVTLFYFEKKSYQEIVEITGFNLAQVKSHIQNGKRNLKIFMEKKMEP
ncbi:MAG TPA: sigma-70 family RNA polymerase sigma factor [Sediminibacterium sp.]|nr:sigma-70 family RNA polymerase sigma factor [Sediminibacterium sp.]